MNGGPKRVVPTLSEEPYLGAQRIGSGGQRVELTVGVLAAFVENEGRAAGDQRMGCGPEWNRPITVAKPLNAQQNWSTLS
ncbi:hypothetical protein Nepgr_013980 [Nepenthes gracilis]|uniref:Uncharacterized protein n=1 Tax=Nepenthes gracilis TaxID=150966 RepID=A0AAD3SK11_NEPGR|nr:hypothetical protein Nepgr_013980 [Nepenthes gracilis]